MTAYILRNANPAKTRADAVVVGLTTGDKGATVAAGGEEVAAAYGRKLRPLLSSLGATGKAGEITKVPTAGTLRSPLLVLVGLGEEATADSVRRGAGAAARAIPNASSIALGLPTETPELVQAVTEGHLLGGYTYTTYRTAKNGDETKRPGDVVVLCKGARRKEHVAAFEKAQLLAGAVAAARDWVNTPPGDLRPPSFADSITDLAGAHAKAHGKKSAVDVTVLDEERLAELGCGGLLAVGGGSSAKPRLVELSYSPKGAKTHLALVGKGITFDSGGLSIKPAQGMNTMKMDMAGAAAIVQATFAIAALGLPVRVTAYAALAENMVSGDSYRPGDVITIYGGKTVEVLNTDAEGRLVLADALERAAEQEPDAIVDVATLTGAMVVALGDRVAGVMGADETVDEILRAGEDAGELLWHMPIPDGMTERIKSSKIADIAQHDWVRWGGGLFAAAFLREFTGGRPWAHIDIAGPAYNSGGPSGHVTSGGTGFAVTTLVELARRLGG